ncbi:MaoC family dehydratase [Variovorax sp. E3]|uniref:MaoC family dehydratase n=1 Tax=Variovorax sp. E3 TaxID=1914993 RepID=UPI0018DDDE40|nr:MaoC family dehydratase [Variovorax sp. E3]
MIELMAAAGHEVRAGYSFSRIHRFDDEQVRTFARIAGDENPLHHDAEFARGTRFGGLIASGAHTTSLLMGLVGSHFAKRGDVLGMSFSVDLLYPVSATETVTLAWVVTSTSATARRKNASVLEMEGSMKDANGRVSVLAYGRILFDPQS